MSPPGKRSGCTTWLSVVKAMRPDGEQGDGVVEALEQRVGEGAHEDIAHQVAVELAAAAVPEQDAAGGVRSAAAGRIRSGAPSAVLTSSMPR